jgi:hypothetical protein
VSPRLTLSFVLSPNCEACPMPVQCIETRHSHSLKTSSHHIVITYHMPYASTRCASP